MFSFTFDASKQIGIGDWTQLHLREYYKEKVTDTAIICSLTLLGKLFIELPITGVKVRTIIAYQAKW